jgi:hypothetical protein
MRSTACAQDADRRPDKIVPNSANGLKQYDFAGTAESAVRYRSFPGGVCEHTSTADTQTAEKSNHGEFGVSIKSQLSTI